jgi:hypothetical protein
MAIDGAREQGFADGEPDVAGFGRTSLLSFVIRQS